MRLIGLSYLRKAHLQQISRINFTTIPIMSNKTALVVVAHGSEEIEAVTPIDTLRRAGVEVTVAGLIDENTITCSRNVYVVPEKSFADAVASTTYDAILLPGGLKGSEAFSQSEALGVVLKEQEKAGRLIAAICAAPTALQQHGIGFGKAITSYPSTKKVLTEGNNYEYKEERVVVAENLITSRGPGTALEWSLAIVEYLVGKDKATEVGNGMLIKL